jgi:hypothetical protein
MDERVPFAVDPVRGDAAALLVRELDDVETRVMDIVTKSDEIPLFNAMWRIRTTEPGKPATWLPVGSASLIMWVEIQALQSWS